MRIDKEHFHRWPKYIRKQRTSFPIAVHAGTSVWSAPSTLHLSCILQCTRRRLSKYGKHSSVALYGLQIRKRGCQTQSSRRRRVIICFSVCRKLTFLRPLEAKNFEASNATQHLRNKEVPQDICLGRWQPNIPSLVTSARVTFNTSYITILVP